MNVKNIFTTLLLLVITFCSCKKNNNNVTPTNTIANIDSMKGSYYGTTYGDSIYSYLGTGGIVVQSVHGFTWVDTLTVTSSDTAQVTVTSKYYTVTFPYGDSLTLFPITDLQYQVSGQNGYASLKSTFSDTTDGPNHLIINVWYGTYKHYTSDVLLYKR